MSLNKEPKKNVTNKKSVFETLGSIVRKLTNKIKPKKTNTRHQNPSQLKASYMLNIPKKKLSNRKVSNVADKKSVFWNIGSAFSKLIKKITSIFKRSQSSKKQPNSPKPPFSPNIYRKTESTKYQYQQKKPTRDTGVAGRL